MKQFLYRIKDRIEEWWRYPQPTTEQKKLLGLYTDVIDTDFTAIRLASEESARYIQDNMRTVANYANDYDFHEAVGTWLHGELKYNGLYMEFGVATGRTLNHWARMFPTSTIHGFDSFLGLPENWTSRMPKGFFSRHHLPRVRKNCELHVGWFEATVPEFLQKHPLTQIALLHVDSDLYSSARYVLETCRDRIRPGTVIVFDEYMNYPGWQKDEFRAWQEFVIKYNIQYEYLGYVSRHQKVAVRIR